MRYSTIIKNLAKKKKARIGITILKSTPAIVKSLARASALADIIVYGKKIGAFKNSAGSPESLGKKLVTDFKRGKIDQFVRGQIDDFAMVEEAKKLFQIEPKLKRIDLTLIKDVFGREFFVTGGSNPDLQTLEEKIRVSTECAKWIGSFFGVKAKIAIMATCRPGSYGKDPAMTQTYDEAEATVRHLRSFGFTVENVHIELERAAKDYDLIVPARGTIGNQILRAIIFLGKGKNLATPTYFPGKLIYEDNFRAEQDWYPHIVFAAALANTEKL